MKSRKMRLNFSLSRISIQLFPLSASDTLSYVAPEAKVLVVDDNEINRKVVKGLLKKSQIKVSEADSGKS